MAGGMAFVRFFISSRRCPLITDTAVGIGVAAQAIAFVLQSRMFRAERGELGDQGVGIAHRGLPMF